MTKLLRPSLGVVLLSTALAACGGGINAGDNDSTSDDVSTDDNPTGPDAAVDDWDQLLTDRQVDYNAALRIASLRLVGALPTLAQVNQVANAGDAAAQRTAYEALVTQFLADPRMAVQMYNWWRDTLKLGTDQNSVDPAATDPLLDSAAAFAAKLSVDNGSYTDLLTATTGTCGSFDEMTGTFAPADCANGGAQAGLLTHPAMMRQFKSNFAFRRVRWVQETFVCTKFPAEMSDAPEDVGGAALYTGLFPFTSVATFPVGKIDFQDRSAVVCANCHSTMNHIAPLFAYYDDNGNMQPNMVVPTPLEGAPPAMMSDYLTDGETTAWRFGEDAADLPALGTAMAADPDIAACAVARAWNWAMGKGDIVDTLQQVPRETIAQQVDDFTADGFKMKDLLFTVFTSDDFVKF